MKCAEQRKDKKIGNQMKFKAGNDTIAIDFDKVEARRDLEGDRLNKHDHALDIELVDE